MAAENDKAVLPLNICFITLGSVSIRVLKPAIIYLTIPIKPVVCSSVRLTHQQL